MTLVTSSSLVDSKNKKEVLRYQELPFEVSTDPFYNKENMEELRMRINDAKSGQNMHEHEITVGRKQEN